MNRATLVRFAVLMLLALSARAQNALEIITLRHRTAEHVLPSLQPLVEPGGTLSGLGRADLCSWRVMGQSSRGRDGEEPLAPSGVARAEPFKQKFEGSDEGLPRTPPF